MVVSLRFRRRGTQAMFHISNSEKNRGPQIGTGCARYALPTLCYTAVLVTDFLSSPNPKSPSSTPGRVLQSAPTSYSLEAVPREVEIGR